MELQREKTKYKIVRLIARTTNHRRRNSPSSSSNQSINGCHGVPHPTKSSQWFSFSLRLTPWATRLTIKPIDQPHSTHRSNPLINPIQPEWKLDEEREEETWTNNEKPNQTWSNNDQRKLEEERFMRWEKERAMSLRELRAERNKY